jgi:UDP-glucose 4-epimerase
VYGKKTPYAKCKAILDDIASCFPQSALGVRIFAGYGPGEGHKGEYASIIYKFCQAMKQGEPPIVFGDGTQTRDFIYIDDVISGIIESRNKERIVELGTGYNSSFNDVIHIINDLLQTNIKPVYIDKPSSYVQETPCRHGISEILHNQIHISLMEGISRILFPEKLL